MKINQIDWRVICIGMMCMTVAEIFALSKGINGTIFTIYALIIGGAIGVVIPNPLPIKK